MTILRILFYFFLSTEGSREVLLFIMEQNIQIGYSFYLKAITYDTFEIIIYLWYQKENTVMLNNVGD